MHFFVQDPEQVESLYETWPIKAVKEIQKRRFLLYKTALEVYFVNGESLLLKFDNISDRDAFAKKIVRQRGQKGV